MALFNQRRHHQLVQQSSLHVFTVTRYWFLGLLGGVGEGAFPIKTIVL